MAKFYARDTANMFLLWAKDLGVSEHILFESNDVVRSNFNARVHGVCVCMACVCVRRRSALML